MAKNIEPTAQALFEKFRAARPWQPEVKQAVVLRAKQSPEYPVFRKLAIEHLRKLIAAIEEYKPAQDPTEFVEGVPVWREQWDFLTSYIKSHERHLPAYNWLLSWIERGAHENEFYSSEGRPEPETEKSPAGGNGREQPPTDFTTKEKALAYIFDLYANGKQIPTNPTEGGYAKKEIQLKGHELFGSDPEKDTFYRSVKTISEKKYDLNKEADLRQISLRWLEAVRHLSKDWPKVEEYLKGKGLAGE